MRGCGAVPLSMGAVRGAQVATADGRTLSALGHGSITHAVIHWRRIASVLQRDMHAHCSIITR